MDIRARPPLTAVRAYNLSQAKTSIAQHCATGNVPIDTLQANPHKATQP